jgi:hypothetical protein
MPPLESPIGTIRSGRNPRPISGDDFHERDPEETALLLSMAFLSNAGRALQPTVMP